MRHSSLLALAASSALTSLASPAVATDYDADPSTYAAIVPTLQPGDTLRLAGGTYPDLLSISNLNGSEAAWIVITGPDSGSPAVFLADPGPCCNTVEIANSSYVAIRNLTIDGNGVDGAFGVSAKGGTANLVHHIAIEGCTFLHHDASQQNVAISTKAPTWGWTIRRNRIVGAGTGLYLGNSDGTCPFIGGLIELNLVQDTVGYNMQIKWQQPRPDIAGMPSDPVSTIIRHNVFIKTDRDSPDGDRPNVLVGGFPSTGAGSDDRYEIYGNLFYHNPRESLLQASGRVTIHDNIFVDTSSAAIRLQDHDLPLRQAHAYNNTIYAASTGISAGGTADQGIDLVGNLVFADTPISGSPTTQLENITDSTANAAQFVHAPSTTLGQMDFYPLAGKCQGAPLGLSSYAADADYAADFNGTSKGTFAFRGAYAGEGVNPGWQLDADIKDLVGAAGAAGASGSGGAPSDGGAEAAGSGGAGGNGGSGGGAAGAGGEGPDAAPGGGGAIAATPQSNEPSGCACRAATPRAQPGWALAAIGLALWAASRRRAR